MRLRVTGCVSLVMLLAGLGTAVELSSRTTALRPAAIAQPVTPDPPTLADAQRLFYTGRYHEAAELALAVRSSGTQLPSAQLGTIELRSSALLFQIKRALGAAGDKDKAFKRCGECAEWMKAFLSEIAGGQALARARLTTHPADEEALFFLGKIDLNYVWLQLGTLGRKTGWSQYWEARKSLDAVLTRNPHHIRARVARAWIDYIVDTRMPRGTRWLLGGGNKKRGLAVVREAARADADFFVHAEAEFALWDLQVRERNLSDAADTARRLVRDFPENRDLLAFLEAHPPDRR